MNSRQLSKFIVLSVEPIDQQHRPSARERGKHMKSRLAECVVARESDFGVCDTQFVCTTHLGYILREGDVVLGYDLVRASWTNDREYLDQLTAPIPDIILVRKVR